MKDIGRLDAAIRYNHRFLHPTVYLPGRSDDSGPRFRKLIRHRVFHPLLLAAYPVLALWAFNVDWLRPQDPLRTLLLSVVVALLLLPILARVLRDWHRAGILVSLLLILFFSYGHLYEAMKSLGLGASLGRHRYLAPVFLAIGISLVWWIVRRLRRPEAATGVLNIVALAALALPVLAIGRSSYTRLTGAGTATEAAVSLHLSESTRPPDIYYIIVDGYARQDTLQKVFEFDNTPFLSFLEERGFYIAGNSRSNYAQTGLSLSSSLNLDYVEALIPGLGDDSVGRQSLWNLIKHSEVRRQLESLGYVTVAFSTGLAGTEWTDADFYLTAGAVDEDLGLVGTNPFESMLIQTSMLRLISDGVVALPRFIPDVRYPYQVHRNRIRNIFDRLKDLPPIEGPKFVFAHIISPHPPFVFAADGSPVTPDAPFTLRFTFDAGDPSNEEYRRGYRDQTIFVNHQLEQVVAAILQNSEVPPVILLQGDHGPDSGSGRVSYIQERMTNLNAYLLPAGADGLYPGITPVNSFRVVFNQLFGGEFPMLDDRVLYSEYAHPYDFQDVTEAIEGP